jgi:hypothetical protein
LRDKINRRENFKKTVKVFGKNKKVITFAAPKGEKTYLGILVKKEKRGKY